jgi:endogenous inhibitor of DNA gyrase (YacG/DUF329 family)
MKCYRCSTCDRSVEYVDGLPKLYPFCSYRCQLVDLGKWLQEEYTIDREITEEDFSDPTVARQLKPEDL